MVGGGGWMRIIRNHRISGQKISIFSPFQAIVTPCSHRSLYPWQQRQITSSRLNGDASVECWGHILHIISIRLWSNQIGTPHLRGNILPSMTTRFGGHHWYLCSNITFQGCTYRRFKNRRSSTITGTWWWFIWPPMSVQCQHSLYMEYLGCS